MHLVEQRRIRDSENAAPAATRMDDQLLNATREADVTMDNHLHEADGYIEADLDFRRAMAEAACDPLVHSLLEYIVGLLREQRLCIFSVNGGAERGPFHCRRILETIERRSPEAPAELMRPHLWQVHKDSTAAQCAEEPAFSKLLL